MFFACVYLRPEQETTEANPQLQATPEAPTPLVLTGAGIVAAAGLFVVFRERQLGKREIDVPPAT